MLYQSGNSEKLGLHASMLKKSHKIEMVQPFRRLGVERSFGKLGSTVRFRTIFPKLRQKSTN
ncbi:MAG: hypothetical protein ACI9IP_001852 [Arcticibacterium sp.]|jgi:hypothetical protein